MDVSLEGLTLHVDDVERSADYYLRFPGATLLYRRPGAHAFALIKIGRSRLGLLGYNAPGFHLEVSTADLDDTYRKLQEVGISPTDKPTLQQWGDRTFHAVDPDGNRIEFDTRLGTL